VVGPLTARGWTPNTTSPYPDHVVVGPLTARAWTPSTPWLDPLTARGRPPDLPDKLCTFQESSSFTGDSWDSHLSIQQLPGRFFGSYVRQEQAADSDVDVLISFSEPPGLLRFIALENHLTDLLGIQVDLVMRDALKPHLGQRILQEVVSV